MGCCNIEKAAVSLPSMCTRKLVSEVDSYQISLKSLFPTKAVCKKMYLRLMNVVKLLLIRDFFIRATYVLLQEHNSMSKKY